MNVEFSNASYKKAIMHSMKYSNHIVNGILVGYFNDEFEKLFVTDSFPLSHGPKLPEHIALGLEYVREYCNLKNETNPNSSIEIVGYYIFGIGEETADTGRSPQSYILSEELFSSIQNPIAVTIKCTEKRLEESLTVRFANKKGELSYSFESPELLKTELKRQMKTLNYLKLVDIEDHLVDPNLDFTNYSI